MAYPSTGPDDHGAIHWTQPPDEYDQRQMDDILDIIEETYDETPTTEAQEWRITFASGNSATLWAPPEAKENIAYGWDIRAAGDTRFTDPNYRFTDDDLIELDIPRNRYVSQSNPPVASPRPADLPKPSPHRIDVRPPRRGPRMPREM